MDLLQNIYDNDNHYSNYVKCYYQNTNSLNRINAILGIALADSSITSEKVFWEFIEGNNDYDIEFPPLVQSLYLIGNSVNSDSLAIFESGWPLWIRNKKNNFRSVVFATSELNVLYHFRKKESNNDLLSLIINKEVNWLLKTDSENENYFRLNKDSFQQGELIKISGTQPFDDSNFKNSISFNIIKDIIKFTMVILSIIMKKIDGRVISGHHHQVVIYLNYSLINLKPLHK